MSLYGLFSERTRANKPVALATVIDGPNIGAMLLVTPENAAQGTLGNAELDRVVARDTQGELEAGRTSVRHYGPEGDFTSALARVAKVLGYHVLVCDAREVFATKRRFPMADEVLVTWPAPLFAERGAQLTQRDAVCILTHDPKFDVPAVVGALATNVGYIGVMGSRKTHAKRVERLVEAGVTDEQLLRLMSPIGLDIGARTPEETAISICGEIIARRTGRGAPSLRDGDGPIHK